NLVKKTLSTRTHICGCGTILYRDHNAAKNILAKGLKQAGIILNTVGHTEINAWGQNDLYSLVVTSTSKSTGPSKNPRAFTRPECQHSSSNPDLIDSEIEQGFCSFPHTPPR
ncbi:MAG: transposase, partial [Cyanobacteriota bacterium]|nr:transposase [Cyanobacteriota bacterium]